MNVMEAIKARHSVRQYEDKVIDMQTRAALDTFVDECNAQSGLHMYIVYDDPNGFDSRLARYGSFKNVSNYIVLAGKDCPDFDELCGYYGEMVVIKAQQLGLNTCWAALTFNKKKVKQMIPEGERFCMVIALGYGATQGVPHKNKPMEKLVASKGQMPDWFAKGVEAAMMAPTAVNQQRFKMGIVDGEPVIKVSGRGFHTLVDLGIVKYHFEAASGRKVN